MKPGFHQGDGKLSVRLPSIDTMAECRHSRGIEVRVEHALLGWHLLAAVEGTVLDIAESHRWRLDFFASLLHEYGAEADYLPSNGASVAQLHAHVAEHAMSTYDAHAFWTFDQVLTGGIDMSVDAVLRIGPSSENPLREVAITASGPDEDAVLGIFDALRAAVEAG